MIRRLETDVRKSCKMDRHRVVRRPAGKEIENVATKAYKVS